MTRAPRPPPVHGKRSCGLLKPLDRGESVTFMAIAVGLLVIALVMFAEGTHALVVARRTGSSRSQLPGP